MKKQKSKQATFDHIVNHMLTQGCASKLACKQRERLDLEPQCGYRGGHSGTLRCAVGCLIGDEFYSPVFEGLPATAGAIVRAVRLSGWSTDLDFGTLQDIHDKEEARDWEGRLAEFAESNGLRFRPKVKR